MLSWVMNINQATSSTGGTMGDCMQELKGKAENAAGKARSSVKKATR
jgi:uncharacterized protein YjbJ (UPF0337 family)